MYSKEEISRFVESEGLDSQSISLPYGIKTAGDSREQAVSILLSRLKKSQTVLDVGSDLGLFCLASLQHGARAVTGFELNRDKLRQAKRIAEFLQLKPNYLRLDIEQFPEIEKHDIVLCLNMLDRLKNPIGVLRYLAENTNDTLIVEAAQIGVPELKTAARFWNKDSKLPGGERALKPELLHTSFKKTFSAFIAPYSPKSLLGTFFFSKLALDVILNSHMKLFSSVQVQASNSRDRYFVVCKKVKIKHLIIVSGTCSSGKSTFIEKALPSGCSVTLGIDDKPFNIVSGSKLRNEKMSKYFRKQTNGSVVFHYDILSVNRFGFDSYDRDACLDILKCAQKVSVVLLAPDQNALLNQIIASEGEDGSMSDYHNDLLKKYKSSSWLREMNLDWLDFLEKSLADADCCDFYDYNSAANQLSHVPTIDSHRELIRKRYSD